MRILTSLAMLGLSLPALAAPPDHAEAKGLDKNCEARAEAPTASEAVDALLDAADESVAAGAELLGLTFGDDDPKVAFGGSGLAYAVASGDDTGIEGLVAVEGYETLAGGDSSLDLGDTAFIVVVVAEDGNTRTYQATAYDADGAEVGTLDHKHDSADSTGNEGGLRLQNKGEPQGTMIQMMYGDIIIGGMPLDDFND